MFELHVRTGLSNLVPAVISKHRDYRWAIYVCIYTPSDRIVKLAVNRYPGSLK
jgi:hypothetical protein